MLSNKTFIRIVSSIVLLFVITTSVNAEGNDFITVDLRTDIPEVANSLDYQVWIETQGGGPNGNFPTYTTAWLSVNLDTVVLQI